MTSYKSVLQGTENKFAREQALNHIEIFPII